MHVYMYVYIYIYIYTNTYIYIYIYIYIGRRVGCLSGASEQGVFDKLTLCYDIIMSYITYVCMYVCNIY